MGTVGGAFSVYLFRGRGPARRLKVQVCSKSAPAKQWGTRTSGHCALCPGQRSSSPRAGDVRTRAGRRAVTHQKTACVHAFESSRRRARAHSFVCAHKCMRETSGPEWRCRKGAGPEGTRKPPPIQVGARRGGGGHLLPESHPGYLASVRWCASSLASV